MELAARWETSENPCIRIVTDGVASGDFRNVDARLAASRCQGL
jgi:hypothetical protein